MIAKRSSRVPPDITPNATARALASLRRAGVPLIDLTESNPTRVGLHYPDDLLAPLADPEALTYEPQALGLAAAREAIAGDYARHGLNVDPDRLALTASTSEAYSLLFKLLCDPGDSVLVPRPSYPLFEHLTRLDVVEAVPYDLDPHGGWRVDVGMVERLLTPRVKALLIVSPNNPTGSFLHRDDLAALAPVLANRRVALIGDEVFADYPLDPAPAACSVLEQQDVFTCALGGFSKSIGLPQVKLGWMAFGGPPELVRDMLAPFEVIADAYLSVSTPVQAAAPALLDRGASIRAQIRERTARNLAALRAALPRCPAVTALPVQGGWSVVLQVPTLASEDAMALELLTRRHLIVHPGYFFDFPRESFVVLSLIVEPARFDEGVERLLAHFGGAVQA